MNKKENFISRGKNRPSRFVYLKRIFCNHNYEIVLIAGMGLIGVPRNADGAKITCYCSKCKKIFVSVHSTPDGKLTKMKR